MTRRTRYSAAFGALILGCLLFGPAAVMPASPGAPADSRIVYLDEEGGKNAAPKKAEGHFRVCAVQTPQIPKDLTGGINAQQFNWLLKHNLVTEGSAFKPVKLSKEQLSKADNLGVPRPSGMPDEIAWAGIKAADIIKWNVDGAIDVLKRASEMEIDFVAFSELYPVPFFPSLAVRDKELLKPFCFDAGLRHNEEMKRLLEAGKSYGVTFSVGVPVLEDGKMFNSNYWVHKGEVVHRYDKTNIPGAREDPQQATGDYQKFTREFGLFTPNSSEIRPAVVEVRGKRVMLGSIICHDRRYDVTRGAEETAQRNALADLKKEFPDAPDIENVPAIVSIPYITPRTIFPPNPKIDAQAYRDHYHGLEAVSMNGAVVLSSTRANEDLGTELMGGTAIFTPAGGDFISLENTRPAMLIKDIPFADGAFASRRAIKWQMNSFNAVPAVKTFLRFTGAGISEKR